MTLIGQRFGNYRAVSLLGEGGMGAVYLAEHPDIGRQVAIKVLRTEWSRDPQLLGRFLNEARAANAIRHPNIIEILDSGTTEEGMPYLVMELLEGEELSKRIARLGRLPLREALEFAYQTASAVGAAHRKGIIHRDLKPDNVFVVPDPLEAGRERIKVLDFGIAKLLVPGRGASVQTRTGTLMGTPVYMSPEQCLGTKELDARSDIYALGLILFEMLCGRPPFFSEGFGDLVNMHLNQAPPSPRSFVPDLPAAVEATILTTLAKRPEERFASMADLQAALKVAAGPTVILRGSSSPDLVRETLPAGGGPPAARPATTFSSHAGDVVATARVRRARRGPLLAGGVAVGGLIAALALSGRAPEPRSTPPAAAGTDTGARPAPAPTASPAAPLPAAVAAKPPAPAKVRLRLDSRPTGATVVSAADGAPLGVTPIDLARDAADGTLDLRLEKRGYAPATIAVPRGRDVEQMVRLERKPAPSRRPRPPRQEEPAKL